MSFDGHVLCQRMLMTPWALTTFGAATAEAVAAATLRKLRRVGRTGFDDFVMAFLSLFTSGGCLSACRIFITQKRSREQKFNRCHPDNSKDCILVRVRHPVCASLSRSAQGAIAPAALRPGRRITLS
jgi:hypothetical protein